MAWVHFSGKTRWNPLLKVCSLGLLTSRTSIDASSTDPYRRERKIGLVIGRLGRVGLVWNRNGISCLHQKGGMPLGSLNLRAIDRVFGMSVVERLRGSIGPETGCRRKIVRPIRGCATQESGCRGEIDEAHVDHHRGSRRSAKL
jgi:hypothetical protein